MLGMRLGLFSLAITFTTALLTADPQAIASAAIRTAASVKQLPQPPGSRVWLLFIDDLHLDFKSTGHLKELFQTIATRLVNDGDLVGVVTTGPSSIAIDLTRDQRALNGVREKISGAALKPSEIIATPDRDSSEVRYRAHIAFDTADSVLKMLAAVPGGPKAFVYISNGYYFDVWRGAPVNAANPFSSRGNTFSLERLRDEVAELVAQAKRSNVTIYAVDPRALSGPPTIDSALDGVAWQKYWTTTRTSLQVIAGQTGGFVIENDLEGNLKRVLSEMR